MWFRNCWYKLWISAPLVKMFLFYFWAFFGFVIANPG